MNRELRVLLVRKAKNKQEETGLMYDELARDVRNMSTFKYFGGQKKSWKAKR